MASRQKSFFDQQPSKKQHFRPRWQHQHSRPANDAIRLPNKPASTEITTGPPIIASTQSRNKLKKFQFIEGCPSEQQTKDQSAANKENLTAMKEKIPPQDSKTPLSKRSLNKPSTVSATQSKICPPSTPAPRLPLADLVGNLEGTHQPRDSTATSPEDHIVWRHESPTSSNPTPAIQRGIKRARSSSPLDSSQNDVSAHLPTKEAFDLQQIQHTLIKTPQADPAADLWNRYAVNAASTNTPSNNKGHAIAQLIADSSPHSPATAGIVSGLRRWASCGLEWPTSKTKRRRTAGVFRDGPGTEDLFGSTKLECQADKPRISKVGILVEKIQETLAKPPRFTLPSGPSSSSPLPDRSCGPGPATSPLQRHVPLPEKSEYEVTPSSPLQQQNKLIEGSCSTSREPSFSVLGDMDLDMVDAASRLETQTGNAKVYDTDNTNTTAPSHLIHIDTEASPEVNLPSQTEATPGSDDNYGIDIEDDELGDYFERLTSMYDKRPEISIPQAQTLSVDIELPEPGSAVSGANQSNPPNQPVVINSDDEFGSDDLGTDDYLEAEAMATQAGQNSQTLQHPSDRSIVPIQRYVITKVSEGHYQNEKMRLQPEKILIVEDEKTKMTKTVILRQSWFDSPCTLGSYLNIIGTFTSNGHCIIDDAKNMLILHPDHLLSATVVADSFQCIRRAVLQDRVKATSNTTPPTLYGHILHEVFQECLKVNRWDMKWLLQVLGKIVPKFYEQILEISSMGVSYDQAINDLKDRLPKLTTWAARFVRTRPLASALVADRNDTRVTMCINKLLDVEEHVWSPQYGLKGNIDATVQVIMREGAGDERTLTVPLELKTGKNNTVASHRAQTALYTLLLSDRYDIDVAYGILYYLETSDTSRIPALHNELRHMVIRRNELACYIRDRFMLPPMLKEDRLCNNCYAQTSCFLYHKLSETGQGELLAPNQKQSFDELVKNLKSSDQDFFRKWDFLLTKEEAEMMKLRKELWTMLSHEREKLGRCFANVIIEPGSMTEHTDGGKINRFSYTFIKEQHNADFSFTESQLRVGEPIVVSDEKGHFALANGYVTNVRKRRITIAVDRRLHNARTKGIGFEANSNQVFTGIMDITTSKSAAMACEQTEDESPILYRLDKDEFSNGMATVRNNLLQIMDDGVYKGNKLRSLIVESTPPQFRQKSTICSIIPSTSSSTINSDQRAAIEKVMSAKDYALVLGMPGTGKTTTIAHIIRALVAQGKSVLLTSYTHTAVDNILLKIRNDNIGILRLGAASKVHPDVQKFATLAAHPRPSVEELEKTWLDPPVVATTCLAISHPLFSRRIFDYCIVDEASQITLPVCLGPIRMAKTFVLVGDHFQLPPLVQNKEAREGGLDISLFKLLSEKHHEAVVSLEHQYRMCADIMTLSNTLVYNGRLKCGNEAVATRSLQLSRSILDQYHPIIANNETEQRCSNTSPNSCFLARVTSPATKVLFVNTDLLSAGAEAPSAAAVVTNPTESRIIAHLVQIFLTAGISSNDMGVITFYRSQLALLRSHLRSAHISSSCTAGSANTGGGIEMHTADKFQGRDKEVIFVSCVRSNTSSNVGELLKDWRRINVAVTRARSKMIIVGSEETLRQNQLIAELLKLCRGNGWCWDLKEADLNMHGFDDHNLIGLTATATARDADTSIPKQWCSRSVREGTGAVSDTPTYITKETEIEDLLADIGVQPTFDSKKNSHTEWNNYPLHITEPSQAVHAFPDRPEAAGTKEMGYSTTIPIELDADLEIEDLLASLDSSPPLCASSSAVNNPTGEVHSNTGNSVTHRSSSKALGSLQSKGKSSRFNKSQMRPLESVLQGPATNKTRQTAKSSTSSSKTRRSPLKKGAIDKKGLLSGRPVLRDIVNGAL